MKIMAAGMERKFWVGQILGIVNLQNLVYGGGEWKEVLWLLGRGAGQSQ